jgi:hypothetical protein
MAVVNLERKSGGQLRAESGGQYQRKMHNMTGHVIYSFDKDDMNSNALHLDLGRNGAGGYLIKAISRNGLIVTRFVQVF